MMQMMQMMDRINELMIMIMKKNYIQPVCETENIQSMHVICNSPEITGGTEPADPNNVEIF